MNVCMVALPSPFLMDEKVFPPLGVLYVAKALQNQDKVVYVHDGPISDIPGNFDCYAISATTPQFPMAVEALHYIRVSGKFLKCKKVLIGGPHATVDPESCINSGFDSVIMGEGEIACGIAIDHNIKLIKCEDHSPCVIPARELINMDEYHYTIVGRRATSVMTSRGCPYSCGFCCKSSGRVRILPAEMVIKELNWLRDWYGYTAFMFFDDIFILDIPRFNKISEWLKCNDIRWRGFVRADLLVKGGRGLVQRMKDSGCVEVGIGIESGSEEILKIVNKGETLSTIKKAIWMLQEEAIRVKGFIIIGLPGESPETLNETEDFLKEMKLDDVDFSIFTPYKGSHIYEHKEKYDIGWDEIDLKDNWYKGKAGEYRSLVFTSKLSREDIVKARDMFERRFKQWK